MASPHPLAGLARRVRGHIVTMSYRSGAPHVGSALSCADILVALYFGVARIDPDEPFAPDRDRIILSKGHAAAALYACLALRGLFPEDRLGEFAGEGTLLAEHPTYPSVPGVECTTGSLGHGLGIGAGMALGMRILGREGRVFVVISDGECDEGSVWETALWAPAQGLGNLCCVVDFNGLQATGRSTEIMRLEPLAEKWRAFGWETVEVDGHSLEDLCVALSAPSVGAPRAIIARTVKGKGVSFMEDDVEWHYRPPRQEDWARALEELGLGGPL